MFFGEGWKAEYKARLSSAGAALQSVIADGNRIFVGSGGGEPRYLTRALVGYLPVYYNIEIVQWQSMGALPEDWAELQGNCRLKTFFVGPNTRKAVNLGYADYIPIHSSAIPPLLRKGASWQPDVCLIQVSPPDEHGFCSLGIAVDINMAAAKSAKTVIAQVNPQMPRTLGDTFLHVTEIHHFVEYEEPLAELNFKQRSSVVERIARYVSQIVDDGSTLQVGFGRVANSVLWYLDDKKDIGIHTEIFTNAHLYLIKKGVITGRKKNLHHGKIIASCCLGSRELYDFVHNNPEVEFHPTDYVNDRAVIGRNDRMVAINSAFEIDLTGQVCADSIGHKVYSGIGGYLDFMHGAYLSDKGKAIIVLPSTSPDGKSRIVSHLTHGAGVLMVRSVISYVVTEFGIAYLHGKTMRERALALINIAHPKFRKQLLNEAKRLRYVYQDQILPPVFEPLYPGQWETERIFPGDRKVVFRPVKPTDERAVQEFFYSMPDEDIYYRFLSAMRAFPHRNTQSMCNIDYEHEMAIVGVTGEVGNETVVALSRYMLDQKSNMAEVDFAVRADWQKLGLCSFLLDYLCKIAQDKGISGFTAYVLPENRSMLAIFQKVGYIVYTRIVNGICYIEFRFDEPAEVCKIDPH
ncbi:MAG: GNAT family N-acetyltransferase [Syntrophobacteraceae bacterium]